MNEVCVCVFVCVCVCVCVCSFVCLFAGVGDLIFLKIFGLKGICYGIIAFLFCSGFLVLYRKWCEAQLRLCVEYFQ